MSKREILPVLQVRDAGNGMLQIHLGHMWSEPRGSPQAEKPTRPPRQAQRGSNAPICSKPENETMTTDPKIAALEQAERDAYHAYTAANRAWAEAREALRRAQLEATGLAGHIVSTKQRWGYGTKRTSREFKFIVDAHNGMRVSGRILKADGTIGSQRKDATLDNVTDLGPYKPAA